MRKFKLIKLYPDGPTNLGFVAKFKEGLPHLYPASIESGCECHVFLDDCLKYPEFWEEIYELEVPDGAILQRVNSNTNKIEHFCIYLNGKNIDLYTINDKVMYKNFCSIDKANKYIKAKTWIEANDLPIVTKIYSLTNSQLIDVTFQADKTLYFEINGVQYKSNIDKLPFHKIYEISYNKNTYKIGDKLLTNNKTELVITGFKYDNNILLIESGSDFGKYFPICYTKINYMEKISNKVLLGTAYSGKNIYKDDRVIVVNTNTYTKGIIESVKELNPKYKYFFTHDDADQWIENKRPQYSKSDIKDLLMKLLNINELMLDNRKGNIVSEFFKENQNE